MFSVRNGYFESHNGIKETDRTLRERIWASFYKKEYVYYDTLVYDNYTTGIEDMMIEMGVQYEFPRNSITKSKNADKLKSPINNILCNNRMSLQDHPFNWRGNPYPQQTKCLCLPSDSVALQATKRTDCHTSVRAGSQ